MRRRLTGSHRTVCGLMMLGLTAACGPSEVPPETSPPVPVVSTLMAMSGHRSGDTDRPPLGVANYLLDVSDGGILVAGYVSAEQAGEYRGVLVRLNAQGMPVWNHEYGGAGDFRVWSAAETDDHGFLAVGFAPEPGGQSDDVWVFRVDGQGTLLWEKTLGGAGDDLAWEVIRTRAGHYAVAAETASQGGGQIDAWLLMLDAAGNVLWERPYGADGIERVFAIAQDRAGQLYATGTIRASEDDPLDVFTLAVRADDGGLVWKDRLDRGKDDTGHGITTDAQGRVWITGYTTSAGAGGQDGFIARYEDGQVQSFQTYGGADDDRIMNLRSGTKGDLFFVGYSRSFTADGTFDAWIGHVSPDGTLQQSLHHGAAVDDRAVHLLARSGRLLVGGSVASAGIGEGAALTVLSVGPF